MRTRQPKVREEFPELPGEDKLRNLILYIADKCASDKYFGTVKLNKLIQRSDFTAFARLGRPITGSEYFAAKLGPVPKLMPKVREQMLADREVAEQIRTVGGGYTERRLVASKRADLSGFSAEEIAIVDAVIEESRKKTGRDMSWRSHGRAWRIARKAPSSIPYESAFLSDRRSPTDYEVARGLELIEERKKRV
jgi:hypothetical protein